MHYSKHPLYHTCNNAIRRCHDNKHPAYENYGGRGIKVYKPWREDITEFIRWVEKHLGLRPSQDYSLDRKDNDGGYKPGNIRWVTKKAQNKNRRNSRIIIYHNKAIHLHDLIRKLGLNKERTISRYRNGWSIEDIINKQSMASGENKPNSKLTEDDVRRIRKRFAKGEVSKSQLAREFGVSNKTIWKIINEEMWKDV